MKRKKGFTLIELLVVIAIIALLSTTVMSSLSSARSKGRDAVRVSELRSIQAALEMYFDKYNTYPVTIYVGCNRGVNDYNDDWCRDTTHNNGITQIANWIPGLQEFMPKMPHNPKPYDPGQSWPYHYYSPSATQYWLMVSLENISKSTCGGGVVYKWFEGTNTCNWWGDRLYVRSMK